MYCHCIYNKDATPLTILLSILKFNVDEIKQNAWISVLLNDF